MGQTNPLGKAALAVCKGDACKLPQTRYCDFTDSERFERLRKHIEW